MTKIYCDCCGKEIKFNSQSFRDIHALSRSNGLPVLCNSRNLFGGNNLLDLCEECDKEFITLFKKLQNKGKREAKKEAKNV